MKGDLKMNIRKIQEIKNQLIKDNYEFTFNNYLRSVEIKTGSRPHPYVNFEEYFYDNLPKDSASMKSFLAMVQRSKDFNPNDTYIWSDGTELHSTNTIYPTICDAETVAKWIVDNNDCLYDDDIRAILDKEDS